MNLSNLPPLKLVSIALVALASIVGGYLFLLEAATFSRALGHELSQVWGTYQDYRTERIVGAEPKPAAVTSSAADGSRVITEARPTRIIPQKPL